MNRRTGVDAALERLVEADLAVRVRLDAFLVRLASTPGAISSSVMNSAIDVITWLGGNCCVPSACRNRPSTTMIRTKLVVISRMAGARLTTVSSSITCSVEASPCGLVQSCGPADACGKQRRGRRFGLRERRRSEYEQHQRRVDHCPKHWRSQWHRDRIADLNSRFKHAARLLAVDRNASTAGANVAGSDSSPRNPLGAGSRDNCRKTCSNALVVLCGSACWHRPTSRSTSAGSVTSVSVSGPAGDERHEHELVADAQQLGELPRGERHAAKHAHHVGRQRAGDASPRRAAAATQTPGTAPITIASALTIV